MLLKIVTYKKYKNFMKFKLEPNQTISQNIVYELSPPHDFIRKTLIKIQKNVDRGSGGPSDLFFLANKTKVPSPEECSVVWY